MFHNYLLIAFDCVKFNFSDMDNGYEIINNQLYVLQKTKCYQYLNATLGILLERFKKKVQLAAVWVI